jgi:serine/threonine-protein kinase RsbW
MLGGFGEVLALDPELLDDVKTSVSEACNNVVLHAYGGEAGPMRVRLFADGERLRVTVSDEGAGLPAAGQAAEETQGIGVSVIRALTEETEFRSGPNGTEVRMVFSGRRDGRRLFEPPEIAELPAESATAINAGEVVVTLAPVALFAPVLGRLARTLAATAHFSLDRFSDVYPVTDTIAAHATAAAASPRLRVRLMASERRLELVAGPFRRGSGAVLKDGPADRASPLVLLSDQVSIEPDGDGEQLHVVVIDHRR